MKQAFFIIALAVTMLFAGINCNGTRKRTADLGVTVAEVEQRLASLKTFSDSDAAPTAPFPNPGRIAAMKAFFDLHAEPGSTLFYAGAPGKMGAPDIVAPLQLSGLYDKSTNPINDAAISSIYAFWVISPHSDGMRSALIIAGNDGAASATPAPAAATPATPATPTPEATADKYTFVVVAVNDGTTKVPGRTEILPPGEMLDGNFVVELNLEDVSALIVRTDDTIDDEIADTIQLKVNRFSGSEIGLGLINMAQPK